MKINRISPDKHKYLQIVSTIAKPPKSLYFIGKLPETRLTSVAIVGTRKPSGYGKEVAAQLAGSLAKHGVVIISGLALGTDAIAHRSALEAGGTTIAVLGNGLPAIYPSSHTALAQQITENGGAILSEYEPETTARPYHFLERNRIVSGLSDAIIIVEAAARSGTLNTASHALEQGREVFVVPGNITSSLSSGCNALLKQGAHPVTCPEDVLEVIAPELLQQQTSLPLGSTPLETTIISLIQSGTRDGELLQQLANVSPAEFSQALTMMELGGIVHPLGANQWSLRQ
jgi:DNA processing protein